MQAIQVYQYGGPEQLVLADIPRPEPKPDEILVRVYAAGVLPMECAIRRGMFPGIFPKAFPYTPGTAFAGVVVEVGAEVTEFQVGQAICGRGPSGSYAEYLTVRSSETAPATNAFGYTVSSAITPLAPKPSTFSFAEAATLSGGATTAWTALMGDAQLEPGQRVLIHAAAGGVGLFAVQFARWKGATVIATASAENHEFVRSLGAEQVIDYRTTRFEEVARDVDVVLDAIGGETLERSLHILRPGGTLVSIVAEPPAELAKQLGVRAIKNAVLPTSAHLRSIVELIDAGHVRTHIQQRFQLKDAPHAHALCETGHGRGRIVLEIPD